MGGKTLTEITTVLVLLHLGLLVTAQECTTGEVRSVSLDSDHSDGVRPFPQYCYNGEWRMFCSGGGVYPQEVEGPTHRVICRHLGYNGDEGPVRNPNNPVILTEDFVRPTSACSGTENTMQDCGGITPLDSCSTPIWIECRPACTNGDIRLVGGSSENEGRVEVCVDGRWGTVCNNGQSLAEAACGHAGFPVQGAQAVTTFGQGFVPVINNCTIQNGDPRLNCTPIPDSSCENMDLGVLCPTFEQGYNDLLAQCSSTDPPVTCPMATECTCPDTTQTTQPGGDITMCDCPTIDNTNGNTVCNTGAPVTGGQTSTIALGAIIGILAAVIIAMTIGWICTCIVIRRQSTVVMSEKRFAVGTAKRQLLNPIYDGTLTPQPKPLAKPQSPQPAYEMAGPGEHTYDVATEPQGTMEPTYDVADVPGPGVYSVLDQKPGNAPQPNQGEEYNVLVHNGNHSNQPPGQDGYNVLVHNGSNQQSVNPPKEEYAKLDL